MRRFAAVAVLLLILCVAGAYASGGDGIQSPWATLIASVCTAAVTWWLTRPRQAAEVQLAGATAMKTSAETISDLFDLVRKLEAEIQDARAQARAAEDRAEALAAEVEELREEVARLNGGRTLATVRTHDSAERPMAAGRLPIKE